MKHLGVVAIASALVLALGVGRSEVPKDKRLQGAWREKAHNGWIRVHLEGTPEDLGYQHGYLLAQEIADMRRVSEFELTSDGKKDYAFYRTAAETVLWPKIEPEYRAELQGIAEGAQAQGVKVDVLDIVVLNALMELTPYYTNWYNTEHHIATSPVPTPEHCSAFVATGSYTKDGRIVIGHNNWTGYMDGSRWNIIFDITPKQGYRILMDGLPGFIHSGDDFGVNSAGLAITETTISHFNGFDPNGIAEFVRARKAMQYAASIDDFARIMKEGNNGGYANNWLVADTRTNEIASLELGLKNVTLRRTKDGYFVGTNFPVNEKLIREETNFDTSNMSESSNARRVRATELIEGREREDRHGIRQEVPLRPLRLLCQAGQSGRENVVRAHRPLASRVEALAARVRARRHRRSQGSRLDAGDEDVLRGFLRASLRPQLQSGGTPRGASAVRQPEGTAARSRFLSMDALLARALAVCLVAAGCAAAGDLDSQIKARTAGFQGTVSVYAKNLDTGASYSLRGDERVRTASTIKLAILSEVYAEAADGRLNLDETIELKAPMKVEGAGILQDLSNGDRLPLRDIVLLMIVLSDNTATNLILDRIGGDAVNARMEALGFKHTRVLGKIGGGGQTKASQDPGNKGFGIGVTTPHEMVDLIAKLGASPEMVAILKKQRYKDGIGRRVTYEVASKSGALDALRSDVGIVYTPKGRVAIAATVDDMPKVDYSDDNVGNILIADLTKILVADLGN